MDLSKLSTEDLKALQAGDISKVSTDGLKYLQQVQTAAPEAEASGLAKVGKVLDYTGGTTRNALAMLLSNKGMSKDDFISALQGKKRFLSSGELLEKMGVKEGKKLSEVVPSLFHDENTSDPNWWQKLTQDVGFLEKGGAADLTERGLKGFGLDVATDPLTWLSMGLAGAAKTSAKAAIPSLLSQAASKVPGARAVLAAARPVGAVVSAPYRASVAAGRVIRELPPAVSLPLQTMINPLSMGLEQTGMGIYRNAMKDVIQEGGKKGKDVATTMMRYGIKSPKNLYEKFQDKLDRLEPVVQDLYRQGSEAGARTNMPKAFEAGQDVLQDYIGRGLTPAEAQQLIGDWAERWPVNASERLEDAAQIKTRLGDSGNPADFYVFQTKSPTAENAAKKAVAQNIRKQNEAGVTKSLGERSGELLSQANHDRGVFIDTLRKAYGVGSLQEPSLLTGKDILRATGEMVVPTQGYEAYQKLSKAAASKRIQGRAGYTLTKMGTSPWFAPLSMDSIRQILNLPETPYSTEEDKLK